MNQIRTCINFFQEQDEVVTYCEFCNKEFSDKKSSIHHSNYCNLNINSNLDSKINSNEINSNEINSNEINSNEINSNEINSNQSSNVNKPGS
jgi:hypothetical protein